MTDREKLIELLMHIPQVNYAEAHVQGMKYVFGCAADYLIANGVTVQRWIPASEPPKEKGWYWVFAPSYCGGSSSGLCNINGIMFAKWNGKNWSIEIGYHKRPGCVTHWMPLPDGPKEGE